MVVAVGEPAAAVVGNSRGGVEPEHNLNSSQPVWGQTGKLEDEQKMAVEEGSVWNTKRLGSRMAVDAASAMTAGGLVAPIITMIDK